MAEGETPVLEAMADSNAVSLERTDLDPASLILVRLAALIAMDAPAASYLTHIGPATEVGVTLDQAVTPPRQGTSGLTPAAAGPREHW